MLKKNIQNKLESSLGHTPTPSQRNLLSKLPEFILSDSNKEIFLIRGYAGTGKTTTIRAIVQTLDSFRLRSLLLAPTGRAAKVLYNYAQKPAFTIHKKIYRQKSGSDGLGEFVLDNNLHKNTLFIVDEASMIANESYEYSAFGSGRLLDDLIRYVYEGKGCKLILIGDTAQLPPVKMEISPALEERKLETYGLKVYQSYLTDILRQSLDSGILYNATRLRQMIASNKISIPKIDHLKFPDVEYISGEEVVEKITDTYDSKGIEETMIITRSNKRANLFNQGIRNQILWREEELSEGDYLMVVRNNYYWAEEEEELDFIANGDVAEIVRILGYQELYNHKFADVVLRFVDYQDIEVDAKIMIDTIHSDSASLTREEGREFYYKVMEDYQDIKTKREKYKKLRENPFFNALQVKFAYAVTCHKAQGGQWKTAFVDHGYFTDEMINKEFVRWLYTAFTRATEKLYLINFHKAFFETDPRE
ncbi:MAG: ATP-dependent RecD-like DNA helicase [Bacteroidales bacterium]